MMRALLENRFKLKVHRETRQEPAYALVVVKGGLRLPAAKPCIDHGSPATPLRQLCGWGQRTAQGVTVVGSTMADFCMALSTRIPLNLDHRMIVDKTAMPGVFDFDLKFPAPDADAGPAAMAADPAGDFEILQARCEEWDSN